MTDFACPACGAEYDLAVAFAHEVDQRALARLATVSVPMGARVLQYLQLFQPPRQRLTAAKKIKLLLQLLPDLERRAITHKGRDWPAPLDAWAAAIDQMLEARSAGRLELPMKGHAYLYAILAGMANQHEARAEAAREAERKAGPRQARQHGPASVLDVVPALVPLAARPAPAPTPAAASPTVRAMRAALRRPPTEPEGQS